MIFNQIFLVLIIQIVLYYNVQFVVSCNIKNGNMPACKNCKHYKLDFSILPNYQFGRCKIYGNKDLITNKINYTYATTVDSHLISRCAITAHYMSFVCLYSCYMSAF
jgi:hypothetical protein